ncbi:hypothetical protein ACFOKJ_04655 [Vogesella amnigena]|uniref:Secreted protein n=1 Tax=Vogesella amnigena TaxID=1507449 RepID=A0ABV7TRS6_9NEIS
MLPSITASLTCCTTMAVLWRVACFRVSAGGLSGFLSSASDWLVASSTKSILLFNTLLFLFGMAYEFTMHSNGCFKPLINFLAVA